MKAEIKTLSKNHLSEVVGIEKVNGMWLWDEDFFCKTLRPANVGGIVLESSKKVIGFAVYQLEDNFINILNMAVHPKYERRKAGTNLILKLKAKLVPKRDYLQIDVRESNLNAQLFLKKMGFRAIEVMRGFHKEPREDAYRFQFIKEK
jgi:ribosomal-protein-alanine N-acetyltransferase